MKYFKAGSTKSFSEEIILDLLLSPGRFEDDPPDYLLDECRGGIKVFLERAPRAECDLFLFNP